MSPESTKGWTSNSHYDVIVIGAGCAGLPAAKNYLQIEPSTSLLLIDANRSIGGVWAKENLYPGLKTNNLLGTYEFPDFPMHEGFGVKKGEHISGEVCHEYLRQYAEKFDLVKRTLLETKVKTVEKIEKGWNLTLQSAKDGGQDGQNQGTRLVTCTKLMVATGLTNLPAPIDILGSESFQPPIINFASFGANFPTLLNDPSIKQVSVIGTGKAAHDSVYLLATSGKRVTWIIRKSGHGPAYMSPPYMWIGPFYCWIEIAVRNDLAGIWAYAYMNGMLESQTRLSIKHIEVSMEEKPKKANPNGIPRETAMNDHEAEKESENILYETALFNRFSLWRAPYGFGARYPDFGFDNIPFFDLLLRDLGLNPWRKGGWIREIFGGPYLPKDYRGVVDEWKSRKGLNH